MHNGLRMDDAELRPWYETTRRWGQTNLTEIDARDYDRAFWVEHWRRTLVQGVIVNAGGIVAYYPSEIPLHYRAEYLGHRDLFGEIVADAREAGLSVLARMDCNRALPEFYAQRPDWFVTLDDGSPLQTQGRFVACVNSPYYTEHIPQILLEIIHRYHPDGFTDNSWTGAGKSTICHCPFCQRGFRDATGQDLPRAQDWDDPVYRNWVLWGYACRERNWDRFAETARAAGGADCLWLGMVNANPFSTHLNFADVRSIAHRSAIMMVDHQSRDKLNGMEQNAVNGLLLHEIAGNDTLLPQSMAHYVRGPQAFRRASMPAEETRSWMRSGFAGGISPWWHHVGAVQEDTRQFETSVQLLRWHRQNERYLYDRTSAANVALLWNQRTIDFYGQDKVHERCALPWRGWTAALTRARIPFAPVHALDAPEDTTRFDTIIVPDLVALSDDEIRRVHSFASSGGSIVLTGLPGILDDRGAKRDDWPFASLVGAHPTGAAIGTGMDPSSNWEVPSGHTYLRLLDSDALGERIATALDRTSLMPFGGTLHRCELNGDLATCATLVPAFPIYPPEFAWMRSSDSGLPAVCSRELAGGGRLVFLPADLDRQYGRLRLPDLGETLAEAIRWSTPQFPIQLSGPGTLSCVPFAHSDGIVVHVVNVTGCNEWPGYTEEVIPVGPLRLVLHKTLLETAGIGRLRAVARSLVNGETLDIGTPSDSPSALAIAIPTIGEHEVILVSGT